MTSEAQGRVVALTASVRRQRALKRKAQALAIIAKVPPGKALVPFLTNEPAHDNVDAIVLWLDSVPGALHLSLSLLRDALTRRLSDEMELQPC